MVSDWLWLVTLGASLVIAVQSMPSLIDEANKIEQPTRPKVVKRSQEVLMFGNQQNRPAGQQLQQTGSEVVNKDDAVANLSPSAEKRTLSNSGLDDVIETSDNQQQQQQQQQQQLQQQVIAASEDNQPKALPISSYFMDQMSPQQQQQQERNYEYGKVLVNELGDVRGVWDMPSSYGRYYAISDEERRKRSNNINESLMTATTTTANVASNPTTTTTSSPIVHAQSQRLALESSAAAAIGQPKRSNLASYYQDSRYKRESDFDPEDFLALLSLYDNERRNRRNWRNYESDDYESNDDESNMINLDDEDPRSSSWLEQQLAYTQQQQQQQPTHHYLNSDPVLASELVALSRSRPSNSYYEQYLAQQYANSAANPVNNQQYDSPLQYATPQYGIPYAQHAYYPVEKRFMVSRKRSQNYDTYGNRMLSSRGYPSYQHQRLLY